MSKKARRRSKKTPMGGENVQRNSDIGDSSIHYPSEYSWEGLEEYYSDTQFKVEPVLSRTHLLLLDYRQFKAARTIQTAYRGWFVRHRQRKQHRAATVIQTEWRRFHAKRQYYRRLEGLAQTTIVQHYNRSACMIQSLWRGWWVRHNIHNQQRLSHYQAFAAEDLLNCVAFKLHHLLRTYHIPGVFSLRNSHCLSKVEKLLSTISFKQYNDRVRAARVKREAQISEAKQSFKNSAYSTRLPYTGPGHSLCEPECCEIYREEDVDQRLYKILGIYEKAARADERTARVNQRKREKKQTHKQKLMAAYHEKTGDFCADVVESMRRWKILKDNQLMVDPDVFKDPKNVENFLREFQSFYSTLKNDCRCHRDLMQEDF